MFNNANLANQYHYFASRSRRLRAEGIYEQALEAHQKCLEIARNMHDEVRIASCYFWIGECLYQLGRKEDAMAILTPNLKTSSQGNVDDLYNSMSKYIIIALDLPSEKHHIASAIQHTRQYLIDIGHLEWQHKLLYLEAELYQMQGFHDKALDLAIEAWAAWRDEYPLFVADAHLFQIAMFQIRLKKVADVERTLIEWEANQNNSFPSYRLAALNRTRSHLNRLLKKPQEAMRYAQRAIDLTKQMQTPESLATMYHSLLWAALIAEDFETAKACIIAIPRTILRRKATSIADYHLMRARHLCGLVPVDIIFDQHYPALPQTLDSTPEIRQSLRRARKLYAIGLHHARKFDKAFDCTWRQDEIRICVDHIDALEAVLI
ncbi:MAG: hypothetical protein WBC91_17350 [Phototrophicaceae bacterium]